MFTEHVKLTRYFHDFSILREQASGLATGCRGGQMEGPCGPWRDEFFGDCSKPCPLFVEWPVRSGVLEGRVSFHSGGTSPSSGWGAG